MTQPVHIPVLLNEVLTALSPAPGQIILDGTLGGGGHTAALARRVGPNGLVLGMDRDLAAIDRTEPILKAEGLPVRLAHANYRDFPEAMRMLNLTHLDGALLDLGLSSDQLADHSRGFSFDAEGDLDLRFDVSEGVPAWVLLNRWSAEEMADVIFRYGEERASRRIARAIVQRREEQPIRRASELAEICRRCLPSSHGLRHRIDPATRTFQALRIAVNGELQALDDFLKCIDDWLAPNGKVAIISFHSLEDRMVKNHFRDSNKLDVVTRKPIEASEEEWERNPRSRSAKLRLAVRREEKGYES
ncbi:MAG: 16S rRNA (cytosine(1402)-N(4))-methyltransferase RsmH [Planctomycetia bacterium]|nr:16S rRNA (cytosine(1402)-N(4))-methyltransferase RsmH [Planctomycetia bacterium]